MIGIARDEAQLLYWAVNLSTTSGCASARSFCSDGSDFRSNNSVTFSDEKVCGQPPLGGVSLPSSPRSSAKIKTIFGF